MALPRVIWVFYTNHQSRKFMPTPLWSRPRALLFGGSGRSRVGSRAPREFDSEDFSTSDEDGEYVPSGGEYSEDDVNELVKEDEVDGDEQAEKTKGKRRKVQSIPARKRKQSSLWLEDEEEDGKEESGGSSSEEGEEDQDGRAENARKKKEDGLWASFLDDAGPTAKAAPSPQVKAAEETEETGSNKLLVKADELEKPKESEKVKITKVFDFAGEEVRVTKEVDAASKEAKSFLKQNEKEKPQAVVPSEAAPALPAGSGIKRSSGMSSLLGKIGAKKQKMSTLEKSKLDWENFKEEEGIGEELAIHNGGKEGYIERKAFLDRVDHRQFEIERDLRLSKMKP
ncbi:craniofacial development protein 1-like [Alexandromys fortis]|uniref:craniofacial development protein 1-like n=1 Tax=Alexandromys fortis TaxID=100897 RepID=UPI0021528E72|nr:craniofacial development protein 1-like [Microtus fortis]